MDTCRWTDSNGMPWIFCDRPCRPGSSWCAEHHARVFQVGTGLADGKIKGGIASLHGTTKESRRHFNKHTDAKWGL